MTFTSYTQSAAFKILQISVLRLALTGVFEEQKQQAEFKLRVEEPSYYSFSSAFAIPALSCYLIIVTAAIVGN